MLLGSDSLTKLFNNPSKESIDSFISDELPGLIRAMNLYGASLRKGFLFIVAAF